MKKRYKILLIILVGFIMISCSKKQEDELLDEIEYPSYTIEEYNKMDNYVFNEMIEDINYKYTYYFDDEMCVNAKEELTFENNELANEFYGEAHNEDIYLKINVDNNVVTYYYKPEYFIYMMYPKDLLIDLLNKEEDPDEYIDF